LRKRASAVGTDKVLAWYITLKPHRSSYIQTQSKALYSGFGKASG